MRHFFPLTGKKPCPDCGQPEGVQLNISSTGYSVGSGFEHKPECPQLRCIHGVLWADDCDTCNAARERDDMDGTGR